MQKKKKEVINKAALDILDNSENIPVQYSVPEKEKDTSVWGKIVGFFNPFKCGHN